MSSAPVILSVDRSEPPDIIRFLEPVMPVVVTGLNDSGWADYKYDGVVLGPEHDGTYQIERKTWFDCAGKLDEIEDLLSRQHHAHPASYQRLLIEGGGIEPDIRGVVVYSRSAGKQVMTGRSVGKQPALFERITGCIAGWSEFLEVYHTASYPGTARVVAGLVKHDQKPLAERTTFRRHFKTITFHPNPQVVKLLGVASNDSNIGQAKAEDLIRVFGTCWAVLSSSPEELSSRVKSVSLNDARMLLRKVGRLDV